MLRGRKRRGKGSRQSTVRLHGLMCKGAGKGGFTELRGGQKSWHPRKGTKLSVLSFNKPKNRLTMCVPAQSLESCPTLFDPTDCSPPGSSVHGILQARILEWVAMPSSRGSSRPRDQTHISYISYIGRRVLYHRETREASKNYTLVILMNLPTKTFDQLSAVIYNKNNTS